MFNLFKRKSKLEKNINKYLKTVDNTKSSTKKDMHKEPLKPVHITETCTQESK